MKIKAGQIITITRGMYSDYGIEAQVLALRDMETNEVVQAFADDLGYRIDANMLLVKADDDHWVDEDEFIAWMIRREWVEPLEPDTVTVWHLGDNGVELECEVQE